MEPRKDGDRTGTSKPVLNYSIQTGEEFSLEFMRAIPKKHLVPGMPHNQNVAPGAGHRTGAEARFDAAIFLTSDNPQPDEVERKPNSENENRRRNLSSTSVPRVPSGGGSSHGLSRGYASSEASETSRTIKILCSFGGKILPRPSDGKLRYVGGETHIIRLGRNISWQELKQKTTAVYNQPHIIKYQLPGEDLDALISVSNDEDLRNMMEECGLLDNADGSPKLRIFLVSSIEFDDMSFSLGSMDSDSGIQYVAAINGMDGIAANSSTGQGLVNTSINELDQFINIDSRPTNLSRDSSNLHAVNASSFIPPDMLPRPMPSALSGDNTANLHSYYSHGMQNLQGSDYSNPVTSERFYNIEGQMSIPLSTPSDYRYMSQFTPFSGTASQRSFDQHSYQDAQTETSAKEEKRVSSNMPHQNNDLDYFQSLENLSGHMAHHDSSASNHMHSGVPTTTSAQEGVTSFLQPSDSAKSLEACTVPKARSTTQGSDISEDDQHSGGAFASGCSDFQVDMIDHSYKNPTPHPGRVFHSERIPREQAGILNRLSKSEDSLNPEFLIRQSQSGPASEYSAENINSAFEETDKPNSAAQAINLHEPTVDDSLIQFEKEFTTNVQKTSPFSEKLLGENRSSDDTSSKNMERVAHAAEQVVAKGKLNEETSQDVETTNQLGSHSAVPHHISWDIPKATLPTDIDCDPVVPCSTSSVNVSHKEPVIPSTQDRDVAGSTERTSPDILSDFFANANSATQSSSPFIDPVHSLNMPNYEPQRWSFFRNLAQNEFPQKDEAQDLAKIEEGAYPLDRLEHRTPNVNNLATQNDIHLEVPSVASHTIGDSSISPPGFISSDNPTAMKNVEGFQVDNPFTNMHEMMPSHTDFEKTEEGRAVGPVMDASFKDNDFEYLQIIKNEDLEELRELGSGTFGTVYHGKWRGSDVAIKRIKKSCFTGRSSELQRLAHEFWREAEILSKLHHPNVVAFYGVVKDGPGGTLATVTEFMVNGSLRHVLQRKDKYLDRRKRLIIAMDAAFGLEYLHSKNIVHFDLKCDNLLVNLKDQSRPICKVGDFGLSKIKRNTLVSGGVRGTLPWMAPELLNGSSNKVSEKVDVFSFGIVMWEILTGEEPYANMHYGAIIGGIVNNTLRPPVPASCDPEWRRLMEQCWAPDPAQRPAFTEIAGRLRSMSVAANQAKASK